MVYYIVSGLFLMFFWCPCMAIYANVQYNGGLLPDIILLTQCYLHRGTCLNAMKRFCIAVFLIPPKRFDIFSPITGGCSEGLGVLCFFLNNSKHIADYSVFPPGAGVFFAKKDPPGVNSKVGGGSLKKYINRNSSGIAQRLYAHFGQSFFWGGN